jgi:homoserine O-succinyltransferase
MALLIDGGRIPPRWAERSFSASLNVRHDSTQECVKIALINNMPDPALEDTEIQFMELLEAASGDIPVRLSFYSLPGVPRGDRAQEHLKHFYCGIDDLWEGRFDALIMTGTEPRQSDLAKEPYWYALTDVLDWAERNTASTVLSCLAAHAGVLHSDGLQRQPLSDKLFGVFDSVSVLDHEFTRPATCPLRFPHSRWNEVRGEALTACGYSILTSSIQGGADLFVKQKKNSLFVHFQGHPEYWAGTLLKEYRRDIKRFLRKERETYPTMPYGYFDAATSKLLAEFQGTAVVNPKPEHMVFFPEAIVAASLRNTWQFSAVHLYRNWLQYVLTRKNKRPAFAAITPNRRGVAIAPTNELV